MNFKKKEIMKNLLTYISCAAAGLVVLASCSKNEPPVFDDANAFIAFGKTAVSIPEATIRTDGVIVNNVNTLKIPVSLASVAGLEETIRFEIVETDEEGGNLYFEEKDDEKIDKTAHAGKHYENMTTSGILSFDKDNRTQYIEIKPLYDENYTGDLKFDIVLHPGETIGLGKASICTVTIADVNHPLTALLGDYEAKSSHKWGAVENPWNMSLSKDEKDDHMVWFFNLFARSGWAIEETMFYGNVNDDLTEIKIPFGQQAEYTYPEGGKEYPFVLYWLKDDSYGKTGSMTIAIIKDDAGNVTSLDFGDEYGVIPMIEFEDGPANVSYAYPGIIATKK